MPAFTLYGSRGSTNTDRVRLTLAEGGFTDYELVLVNLQKGEQKVCGPFSLKTMQLLLVRANNKSHRVPQSILIHQTFVRLPATSDFRER